MELKFKTGDILYQRHIKEYFLVVKANSPFRGMYVIQELKTKKTFNRNKDVIETYCILASNQQAVQVLFGNK